MNEQVREEIKTVGTRDCMLGPEQGDYLHVQQLRYQKRKQ